jgi:hypothetical protein
MPTDHQRALILETVLKTKEGNDRRVTLTKRVTFRLEGDANPPRYIATIEYTGADEEDLIFFVTRDSLKKANSYFSTWGELTK